MPKADYNGWPNRATWNVMLWMNNDPGAYRLYVDQVKRFRRDGKRFNGSDAYEVCRDALGDSTTDGIRLDDKRIRWGAIALAMRQGVEKE